MEPILILMTTRNRLTAVSGSPSISFAYNAQGDRLSQTIGETTTHFTLDLNARLTQVMVDGINTYLYGAGRIAQYNASGAAYFLGDALGSVRQLTDTNGEITLAMNYEPYGEMLSSVGNAATSYGYTGEWTDSYIKFLYLRSRWYSSSLNQFIQPDSIVPNYTDPQSINLYSYVRNNPVRFTGPTGLTPYRTLYPTQITRNERDLTWWLYKELTTNVNSNYVQRIRTLLLDQHKRNPML